MRRKAFSARECFSVCLCESKLWVCSSTTFYGKVSFPPLCPQRLPETDRACKLLCCAVLRSVYVCVCVCECLDVCGTDAAGLREQHRKRQSSDRVRDS